MEVVFHGSSNLTNATMKSTELYMRLSLKIRTLVDGVHIMLFISR